MLYAARVLACALALAGSLRTEQAEGECETTAVTAPTEACFEKREHGWSGSRNQESGGDAQGGEPSRPPYVLPPSVVGHRSQSCRTSWRRHGRCAWYELDEEVLLGYTEQPKCRGGVPKSFPAVEAT